MDPNYTHRGKRFPKEEVNIKTLLLFLLVPFALAAVLTGKLPAHYLPADGGIVYRYTREQLTTMYPGYFFFTGPREAKKVALTFDDGPDDDVTPQILTILKENSVKGTFFVIGKNAQMHQDMLRRIVAEGHIIGNHTWSHPNMLRLNPGRVRQEIEKNQELLERLTGLKTALVRLPWGAISTNVMNLAEDSRKSPYQNSLASYRRKCSLIAFLSGKFSCTRARCSRTSPRPRR
ncbi:MAG TPA: polysaccharide deacetylase family protein, partial [Spirochaetia bacterium]|nr:polysaccharide deacetylase family protein [Spirochaetia bacterium]